MFLTSLNNYSKSIMYWEFLVFKLKSSNLAEILLAFDVCCGKYFIACLLRLMFIIVWYARKVWRCQRVNHFKEWQTWYNGQKNNCHSQLVLLLKYNSCFKLYRLTFNWFLPHDWCDIYIHILLCGRLSWKQCVELHL